MAEIIQRDPRLIAGDSRARHRTGFSVTGAVGITPRVANLAPGGFFAGYRIEGLIRRGGMGVVYRAAESHPARTVALKVVAPEYAADPSFRARFLREGQAAASIEHPHVVPVWRVGEEEGLLFIAMRFIRGEDLAALIVAEGPLDPLAAATVVDQVADALDTAHEHGHIHRDVKPANVLVERRRRGLHAYLTDFGLARQLAVTRDLTAPGNVVGTTDYMAPEVWKDERLDARVDIYALGCVLFEALTGRVPYPRDTYPARMYAHVEAPPPSVSDVLPGLGSQFDAVIYRALAKDPADRYPSAGDLGRAAVAAARGESVTEPERSVASGDAAALDAPMAKLSLRTEAPTVADHALSVTGRKGEVRTEPTNPLQTNPTLERPVVTPLVRHDRRATGPQAPAKANVQRASYPRRDHARTPRRRSPVARRAVVPLLAATAVAVFAITKANLGSGGDPGQNVAAAINLETQPFVGQRFSVRLPRAAWVPQGIEKYGESHWDSSWYADTATPRVRMLFRIDYSPSHFGSCTSATGEIRNVVSSPKTKGYTLVSLNKIRLSYDSAACRWQYMLLTNGVLYRYVDTFSTACGLSYAVLGRTPPGLWQHYQNAFYEATASVEPGCLRHS